VQRNWEFLLAPGAEDSSRLDKKVWIYYKRSS
jgi:hypothetical protein